MTRAIAESFVRARLAAVALPDFPGTIPAELDAAYAIQDAAIAMWPDAIAGWKVGRIPSPARERYGEDRLVGPIFRRAVQTARSGETVTVPVFGGGFAAVEAEFVFRLASDAPADKQTWTLDEAAQMVAAMHIGVEPASSPLASINQLGPAVVVSDFGNNAGLIVGPEIPQWRSRDTSTLVCETFIEGRSVGRGGANSIPGTPLAALTFALARCARRGKPLRAGEFLSSGAATGIHDILPGQSARISFAGDGEILCRVVAAQPATAVSRASAR